MKKTKTKKLFKKRISKQIKQKRIFKHPNRKNNAFHLKVKLLWLALVRHTIQQQQQKVLQ